MADNQLEKKNSNALGQFQQFSSGLNTGQKAGIIGAIAVVLVVIVMIISSASSGNMKTLYKGLSDTDAAGVVEYLTENNIDYEISPTGNIIKVESDKVNEARMALATKGIPGEGGVGYEIFDETNLGMSEFVQKINYRRALEGELSRTINSFDEVEKSRVHIVIPETALFTKDQKAPTASVTVHLNNSRRLPQSSVIGIQSLVANSIEGMESDHVKVTDHRGRLLSEDIVDVNSAAGVTEAQHNQQKSVESYLQAKVEDLMAGALGEGNAKVKVNAELDFTRIEKTLTSFDPESQVARSEQNINNESQTTDSLSFPYVNMAKNEGNSLTNYEISNSVEHIIQEVGAIKKLSIAAMINGTTELVDNNGVKEVKYSPRSDEDMQKFEEIVRNAVGYDPTRNDQISVINVPFEHTLTIDQFDLNEPVEWYDDPANKKIILILVGLVLVGILMYLLVRSPFVKEKMKVALSLPTDASLSESLASGKQSLDELDLDDEMMFMPSDVPDQMLLNGEKQAKLTGRNLRLELEEAMNSMGTDRGQNISLDTRSQGEMVLDDFETLSEERLMKLEIKKKIEQFMINHPEEAVKLIRTYAASNTDGSLQLE
ncbi:MAG: flagellar basal-body MS-ring/collar protein FliF [Candidatus Kapaibacterium sp.]